MSAEKVKGRAHIKIASYVCTDYPASAASDVWTIDHNLNSAGIIAQFFDDENNEIVPNTFTLTSSNQCVATWNTDVSGYALIDYVERTWTFDSIINQVSYWKVGTGGSLSYKVIANNDLETPAASGSFLRDYYQDDNYYYFDFEVPLMVNDLEITEMGLFSPDNNIMFYTICSNFHKPSNMALTVHYRIEKVI